MDKWRGTAVPNTGLVEKVYLNINLNDEEITEICSKLTMKLEGWAEYILNTAESSDISLYIVDLETAYNQKGYAIINTITEEKYYVSTQNEISDEYPFVGWNPDFNGEIVVNKELTSEYNGVASGTQNELIFELFSSEPIIKLKLNLDEFLTDLADSIRYVKGTEEKVNAQNYSSEIRKFKGSSGGGASTPVDNGAIYEGKYRVRYFDTDGTILKIEYVAEGGKLTPPDNPSYDPDYLIFAEWNYDTENYIVGQPTDIDATYNTVDNATYLFCRFTTKTGLNPTLGFTGASLIDWGDGTVDTYIAHTYANAGEYIIKIYGDIIAGNKILGASFQNQALQKIYIKNGFTNLIDSAFTECRCLTNIIIPESVTSIGSRAFQNCYSLTNIIIPKSVISIGGSAFDNCYSLINISIPEGVTSIGSYTFRGCSNLKKVSIPKSVISIESSAFNNCYSLTNYFIYCDTVPAVSNTNVFSNINKGAIMWVNDSIIEELKVSTNWSEYALHMKPLSWYPSLTDPNA